MDTSVDALLMNIFICVGMLSFYLPPFRLLLRSTVYSNSAFDFGDSRSIIDVDG